MSKAPPTVKALLDRNHQVVKTWTPRPLLSEAKASGAIPPSVVVITCCDIRCYPAEFLDAAPSDALIMRNVGGHVKAFLPDIAALDNVLGIQEIMIFHHTDCGATHYSDETVRNAINARSPGAVDQTTTFGAIVDLEQSLRDNVALLRASPLIREALGQESHGYLFDVKSGVVKRVV